MNPIRQLPWLLGAVVFILGMQVLQPHSRPEVPKTKIIVGVLEDVPGAYAGQSDFRVVRAVFQKVGDDWKPFPNDCRDTDCLTAVTRSYPAEVTWTIAFDGRNLGRVRATTPKSFEFYSSIGFEDIVSKTPVPTIRKRSMEYSGFLESPVYRPLIAVSQPNFQDPQQWKRITIQPEVAMSLRQEFRNRFPNVSNCRNPDENSLRPWPYTDVDVKFRKAYRSNDNKIVSSVQLDPWRCDGPVDAPGDNGGPFDLQWFLVNPGGKTSFVGSGMWLLDAGDYDADGKSELIFVIDGYDLGGYEIFYDDFAKHAVFNFSYH